MYLGIVGNYNKINKETLIISIFIQFICLVTYGYVPTLSIPK